MRKYDSTTMSVIVAAVLAAGVGLTVQYTSAKRSLERVAVQVPGSGKGTVEKVSLTGAALFGSTAQAQTAPAAPAVKPAAAPARIAWAASAPGRLEPKGGELRIGAQASGKLVEVLVALNDKVMAGDLLARIDDEDLQSRLVAAEAEVSVRKRERDAETVSGQAKERRTADDAAAAAERALNASRREFDRVVMARRAGTGQGQT
jgi:multidrug efflux pump subunit AcrA (membrane-fusion protein)